MPAKALLVTGASRGIGPRLRPARRPERLGGRRQLSRGRPGGGRRCGRDDRHKGGGQPSRSRATSLMPSFDALAMFDAATVATQDLGRPVQRYPQACLWSIRINDLAVAFVHIRP